MATRRIKFWQLFLLFVFMGILAGLFSIMCQSASPDVKLRAMSKVSAFLLGFGPSLAFFLAIWLAVGTSVRKKGLPV